MTTRNVPKLLPINKESQPMARHVFISHSHEDAPRANALLEALEDRSVKCWIAPRDVTPGGSYAEAILTAIEGSSCFVLVYSKASNSSRHVLREVERALVLGINIVPVRFDDAAVSKSLDYLLATVHWISVPSNSGGAIDDVAERIRACALAAEGLSATAPEVPAAHGKSAEWTGKRPPSRERVLLSVCAVLALAIMGLLAFFFSQRTGTEHKAAASATTPALQTPVPTITPAAITEAGLPSSPAGAPAPTTVEKTSLLPPATVPAAESESVNASSGSRWLIPDSSSRILTLAELRQFSRELLWRARNEIYARRGLIFSSERGQKLAAQLGPEYRGTEMNQDVVTERLTPIEKKNVSLLKALEAGNVTLGTVRDPDGYTNVRASASVQSRIVGRASDGETVQIVGRTGAWLSVLSLGSGFEGYIHESRIRVVR